MFLTFPKCDNGSRKLVDIKKKWLHKNMEDQISDC
jgi:hypothetical protein